MLTYVTNRAFFSISLLFLSLTLSACGGGGQGSSTETAGGNSSASLSSVGVNVDAYNDMDILRALYLNVRTPAGFHSETYPYSDVYYSTSHVKSAELLPIAHRAGVARYELSTDDFAEALDWSEQAAILMPMYKQLVDTRETDLYFEFTRVNLNYPQFVHLSRVFKSSAIDRSGVDLTQPGTYQGRITLQTLPADRVKMIMEYFWTFSFSNNTGNAVLKSYTTETDTDYIHKMEEAKLITGPLGQCDTVEIFETTYLVEKETGDIWKYQEMTREISSKYNEGEFEVCDNG